jgi:hypothetical protein
MLDKLLLQDARSGFPAYSEKEFRERTGTLRFAIVRNGGLVVHHDSRRSAPTTGNVPSRAKLAVLIALTDGD